MNCKVSEEMGDKKKLASYCGVPVSMIVSIRLARFYTCSLHDGLSDCTIVRYSLPEGAEDEDG